MGHGMAREGGFGRDRLTVRARFFGEDAFVAGVGMAGWPRWDLSGLGVADQWLGGKFLADCRRCCRGDQGCRW